MSDQSSEKKHPFLDIEYQLYYGSARPTRVFNLGVLKLMSIVFIALGLIGVYFLASLAPVPVMKIADIYGQYLMNYATVIIEGNATGIPYVSVQSGRISLRFPVNDSTGEMNLYIYDPEARKVLKLCNESYDRCKIPFPGDRVRALVQIRVRETYTYGIIQSIDFLEVNHTTPLVPMYVKSLTIDMENMYVKAGGIITSIRNVSSGILVYVDTGEDTVTVLIPKLLNYIYGDDVEYKTKIQSLMVGVKANFSGIVYLYRGVSPEIVPRCKEDIEVQPMSIREVTLAEVPNYVGEVVKAEVVMGQVEYERGKYIVTAYDDTGSIELVFDKDVFVKEFDPFNIGTGTRIVIVGTVESPSRVIVMKHDIIEPYPSPLLSIGDITEDLDGYTVVVRGIITSLSISSGYTIFYIEDLTGRIKVFIPSSTFSLLDRKNLVVEGNEIVLAGYIDIYRGELEIVVYTAGGVQPSDYPVPGEGQSIPSLPGVAPSPPTGGVVQVKVSDLSNYVGQQVVAEVVLAGVSYYKGSNAEFYVLDVSDDTGSTKVAVKSSLMRAPAIDPWSVGPGSKLKITGTVKNDIQDLGIYIYALEISVTQAVPPPTPSIEELKGMELGCIVVLQDVSVDEYVETKGGWVVYVSDGSGSIKVFIPKSIVQDLPASVKQAIESGATISVAGYLSEYKGEKEVVVYTVSGVKV